MKPLAETGYGIAVHWVDGIVPRQGKPLPLEQAVSRFDVKRFADQAAECGAGHVMFTPWHNSFWLACPNPVVDEICPGRTSRRDLVMDLAGRSRGA
jgi:hypothetical protein